MVSSGDLYQLKGLTSGNSLGVLEESSASSSIGPVLFVTSKDRIKDWAITLMQLGDLKVLVIDTKVRSTLRDLKLLPESDLI